MLSVTATIFYRFLAVCFNPNSKVAHDSIIQLKSLAGRNGRGLLEPALGALVQGVRAKRLVGWLVGWSMGETTTS